MDQTVLGRYWYWYADPNRNFCHLVVTITEMYSSDTRTRGIHQKEKIFLTANKYPPPLVFSLVDEDRSVLYNLNSLSCNFRPPMESSIQVYLMNIISYDKINTFCIKSANWVGRSSHSYNKPDFTDESDPADRMPAAGDYMTYWQFLGFREHYDLLCSPPNFPISAPVTTVTDTLSSMLGLLSSWPT